MNRPNTVSISVPALPNPSQTHQLTRWYTTSLHLMIIPTTKHASPYPLIRTSHLDTIPKASLRRDPL
ncbi:hypothetical protein CP488_01734 [Chthonomonas calidirosea]|nr:hypothetical protein CP488_01734 [Chthonomonas calidirosea]